jgi:hypothetical protein
MSIEATYRRVTQEVFQELTCNPVGAAERAYSLWCPDDDPFDPESTVARYEKEEASGLVFRLYQEWHALHYLLTGEWDLNNPSRVPPPLGNVVMGGTPTPIEASYGPVRSLSPDEVRALARIPAEELQRRYDAAQFNAHRIYPNPRPGGWDKEGLDELIDLYPRLVDFFARAAEAGDIVLVSSD